MSKQVLITGGAGFLGSHLADELLEQGHTVRVLDNLSASVHGPDPEFPEYISRDVELMLGDLRDPKCVREALRSVDVVFHFADVQCSNRSVQSQGQEENIGTALLLAALSQNPVEKLVHASCMSVYGEGLYRDAAGNVLAPPDRTLDQLRRREWELRDSNGNVLTPLPTPETKAPSVGSPTRKRKIEQERMCLSIGRAHKIPTVVLRIANVYGPRQGLSNPYSGLLTLFASRLMNDCAPEVFEDGLQQRDFVHIADAVQACRLAMDKPEAAGKVINIGSGDGLSQLEVAQGLAFALGKGNIEPEVTGRFRVGEVRNCIADISLARELLGYEPQVSLQEGLIEFIAWLESRVSVDRVELATV